MAFRPAMMGAAPAAAPLTREEQLRQLGYSDAEISAMLGIADSFESPEELQSFLDMQLEEYGNRAESTPTEDIGRGIGGMVMDVAGGTIDMATRPQPEVTLPAPDDAPAPVHAATEEFANRNHGVKGAVMGALGGVNEGLRWLHGKLGGDPTDTTYIDELLAEHNAEYGQRVQLENQQRRDAGRPSLEEERQDSFAGMMADEAAAQADALRDGQSAYHKIEQLKLAGKIEDASLWELGSYIVRNPLDVGRVLAPDTVGLALPGGAVGRMARSGMKRSLTVSDFTRAAKASEAEITALADKLGGNVGMTAIGASAAESGAAQVRDEILATPEEELLRTSEDYAAMIEAGMPAKDARDLLARTAYSNTLGAGGLANLITMGVAARFGGNVLEDALSGAGVRAGAGGMAARAVVGGSKEAIFEAPQGAGEQIAQNVGRMAVGMEPAGGLMEGTGTAALLEGFAGLPGGMVAGAFAKPALPPATEGEAAAEKALDEARGLRQLAQGPSRATVEGELAAAMERTRDTSLPIEQRREARKQASALRSQLDVMDAGARGSASGGSSAAPTPTPSATAAATAGERAAPASGTATAEALAEATGRPVPPVPTATPETADQVAEDYLNQVAGITPQETRATPQAPDPAAPSASAEPSIATGAVGSVPGMGTPAAPAAVPVAPAPDVAQSAPVAPAPEPAAAAEPERPTLTVPTTPPATTSTVTETFDLRTEPAVTGVETAVTRAFSHGVAIDLERNGDSVTAAKYRQPGAMEEVKLSPKVMSRIKLMSRIIGRPIHVMRDNVGGHSMAAAALNGERIVLFAGKNAVYSPMALIGHEFLHTLRKSRPDLYRQFVAFANQRINRGSKHRDRMSRAYTGIPAAKLDALGQRADTDGLHPSQAQSVRKAADTVEEEIIADLWGDLFNSDEFWQELAAENPPLFKQVLNDIIEFLTKLASRAKTLGSAETFNDIETLRKQAVRIFNEYASTDQQASNRPRSADTKARVDTNEKRDDETDEEYRERLEYEDVGALDAPVDADPETESELIDALVHLHPDKSMQEIGVLLRSTPREEIVRQSRAARDKGGVDVKAKKLPRGAADASDWTQVGPQLGSNPGGIYEAPDGSRYYVKFYDNPEQTRGEMVAFGVVNAMGVHTPDVQLVSRAAPDGRDRLGIAFAWEDGRRKITAADRKDRKIGNAIIRAWAAAALTANWDVVGLENDNLVLTAEGKVMVADAGGSLDFRAQGASKAFSHDHVPEMATLLSKDMNRNAAEMFSELVMADGKRTDNVAGAAVESLTDAKIDAALDAAELEPGVRGLYRRALRGRRDVMLRALGKEVEGQDDAFVAPDADGIEVGEYSDEDIEAYYNNPGEQAMDAGAKAAFETTKPDDTRRWRAPGGMVYGDRELRQGGSGFAAQFIPGLPNRAAPIDPSRITPELAKAISNAHASAKHADGTPKVLLHATSTDFTVTRGKQGQAFFASESPRFVQRYAGASRWWLDRRGMSGKDGDPVPTFGGEPLHELLPERIPQIVEDAGISVGDLDAPRVAVRALRAAAGDAAAAREQLNDESFLSELPTGTEPWVLDEAAELLGNGAFVDLLSLPKQDFVGMNVVPVIITAERIWDFRNPYDVKRLFAEMDERFGAQEYIGGAPDRFGDVSIDLRREEAKPAIKQGQWDAIEMAPIVEMIRAMGYEGYLVREHDGAGNTETNIAVFDSKHVKSLTGNVGSWGVRAPTAEELAHLGLTVEQAVEMQRNGDIRFRLNVNGQPVLSALNFAFFRGWLSDKWGKVEEVMLDEYRSLKDIQSKVQAHIAQRLPDYANAWRRENLRHGAFQEQRTQAELRFLRPMIAAVTRAGGNMAEFSRFLWWRHAAEREAYMLDRYAKFEVVVKEAGKPWTRVAVGGTREIAERKARRFRGQQGVQVEIHDTGIPERQPGQFAGISATEAAQKIAALDPRARRGYERGARFIDALRKYTLKTLVDSGQISAEQRDALLSQYQHYVPLRGDPNADDDPFLDFGRSGAGLNMNRNALGKRATGRQSEPSNIIEEMKRDMENALVGAQKQRVLSSLVRMIVMNPDEALWSVSPVKYEKRWVNGVLTYVPTDGDPEKQIILMQHGRPVRIEIREPNLRRALMNLNRDPSTKWMRRVGRVTRYLSAVKTALSPYFLVVNPLRDAGFALMSLDAEHPESIPVFARYYQHAYSTLWGIARSDKRQQQRPDNPTARKLAEYEREWSTAGGRTGYTYINDITKQRDELRTLVRRHGKASRAQKIAADGAVRGSYEHVAATLRKAGDFIESLNEVAENSARLAAFAAMRDKGMGIEEAAAYAKNITVNFNRKGSAAHNLGHLYMFYNAAVQGGARLGQLLKNKRFQKTMGGLFAASYATALGQMFALGDDDDGESIYEKQVGDAAWKRSFPIHLGGGVGPLNIPVPYGPNIFTYFGYQMARVHYAMARGRDPKVATGVGEMAGQIANAFTPIQVDRGALALLPEFARIPVQMYANVSDFGGKISNYVDAYDENKDDPRWDESDPRSNPALVMVAAAINRATGGNDYDAGFINMTAEEVKYGLQQVTGGLGRLGTESAELFDTLMAGIDPDPADIPLVNVYFRGKDPERTQGRVYAENRAEYSKAVEDWKSAVKRQDEDKIRELLESDAWVQTAHLDASTRAGKAAQAGTVMQAKRDIDKRMKALREQRTAMHANRDIPAGERKRALRDIDTQLAELQKEFNRAFNRARGYTQ